MQSSFLCEISINSKIRNINSLKVPGELKVCNLKKYEIGKSSRDKIAKEKSGSTPFPPLYILNFHLSAC